MPPTPNAELAQRLRVEAAEAARRRQVLLTAATALSTTRTLAAAKRALTEVDTGTAPAVTEALALLDGLAT